MMAESNGVKHATVEEHNDPNSVLPRMLFEQESHDLFCPVCDHAVTGEVILQKRKRGVERGQPEGMPHGVQANLHNESPGPSRVTQDSATDSTEEDDLEVPSTLQEQTNFDLLCPDCESCITHEVILQKRKRDTKPSTEGLVPQRHRRHSERRKTGEGIDPARGSHPPSKRHKESENAADAEGAGNEIRQILEYQRIYDLSCPDCTSPITYRVTLEDKKSASGQPVGLLEKKSRRHRRSTTPVDDNPWRTRYELQHGHSKPATLRRGGKQGKPTTNGSLAQPGEREDPQNLGAKSGTGVADRSIAKPKEREVPQSRGAEQGTAVEKKSSAQPDELQDPTSGAGNYQTDIEKAASLTEPLLPEQQDSTGELDVPRRTIGNRLWDLTRGCLLPAITYFIVMGCLYGVWWALDRIPPYS